MYVATKLLETALYSHIKGEITAEFRHIKWQISRVEWFGPTRVNTSFPDTFLRAQSQDQGQQYHKNLYRELRKL